MNIYKKIIFSLIAISTTSINANEQVKEATPTFPVTHFEKSHKSDKEITSKEKSFDLVMIGDSITNGWDADPRQVMLNEAFPGQKILNLGISGDVTQGVLWRLDDGVLSGVDAKAVMIMIGTNNIGRRASAKAEHVALGIKEIIRYIKKDVPNAKILLLGIFPRGNDDNNGSRKKVYEINEIIKNYHDGETVFYKDLKKVFLNEDGSANENMSRDKLHLSNEGYQAWLNAVKEDLLKLQAK